MKRCLNVEYFYVKCSSRAIAVVFVADVPIATRLLQDEPCMFGRQPVVELATVINSSAITSNCIKMASTDTEKQPLLASQQDSQPSLSELQQRVFTAQREYIKAWSKTTSGKWHRRIMIGTTAILLIFMAFCLTVLASDSLIEDDGGWMLDGRVPLEAHIMSKCPDAKDCLHDLVLPAMQQVSSKVDFKLSYIGKWVLQKLLFML